jgi:cytochrome c oxidase cbb3-type subunit III
MRLSDSLIMFSAMGSDRFSLREKMADGRAVRQRAWWATAVVAATMSTGILRGQLQSPTPQQSPSQTPPTPASEIGQQLFSSNCAGCHGLDGRVGEHAPNIATVSRVQGFSDRDLIRIVHDGIQSAGMPGFGSRFNDGQIKAVVAYLRVLQGKQAAVVLPGNAENGRAIFFGKAQCAKCHAIEGKGGFIAGDLSSYGGTHTAAEMELAITEPNKFLDPRQRAVEVVTRDGKKLSGVARNEDNFSLQLQTLDGAFHMLDKSDLTRLERQPRTIMPDDYGSKLTRGELNDLVRYLAAAGAKPSASIHDEEE